MHGGWSSKSDDRTLSVDLFQSSPSTAVIKSKESSSSLEEWDEDVRPTCGEQRKGENRGKSAVHDGRRDILHNKDDALVPRSFPVEETVHNVRAKVHAQAHWDDEHAHRGDVNCETPPVHEA